MTARVAPIRVSEVGPSELRMPFRKERVAGQQVPSLFFFPWALSLGPRIACLPYARGPRSWRPMDKHIRSCPHTCIEYSTPQPTNKVTDLIEDTCGFIQCFNGSTFNLPLACPKSKDKKRQNDARLALATNSANNV